MKWWPVVLIAMIPGVVFGAIAGVAYALARTAGQWTDDDDAC